MQSPNIKYLPGVDHLRGLAALLIVVFHGVIIIGQQQQFGGRVEGAWTYTKNPLLAAIYEGHTAVSLFMVLSGFIFAFGSRNSEIAWGGFIKNRVLRIVPLMATMIVVGLYAFPAAFSVSGLFQHVTLLSNLPGASAMGPFSQMFWTIAVEFQFYLICPFLILFMRQRGIQYGVGLIALAIAFRWFAVLNGANPRDLSYWTIVGRIDQFVVGILLGLHFAPPPRGTAQSKVGKLLAMSALALGMLFAFHRAGGWPVIADWKILWPTMEALIWAAFIATYLNVAPLINQRLSAVLCSLGSISFSVYLVHRVVIETIAAKNWLIPISVVGGTANYFLNVLLIAVPGTVAFSYATFAVIEKPFLDLRVRYKKDAAIDRRQAA